MVRSLLKIATQVDGPKLFDDGVTSAHTAGVAESTSIQLQAWIEAGILTQLKDLKGTANWYDDTTSDLETLAGATTTRPWVCDVGLLSQASGTGSSLLLATNLTGNAALAADDASVANYIIAHGSDSTGAALTNTRVQILETSTNNQISDNDDTTDSNEVYGELELRTDADANVLEATFPVVAFDGTSDFQLRVNFFSDINNVKTAYTFPSGKTIDIYYRLQTTLQDADKFCTVNGSAGVVDSASEINIGVLTFTNDFDVTDNTTVTANLDALDTAHGNRTYTNDNDVTDGESFTSSLDALDTAHGNRTYTNDFDVTDGETFTASLDSLDTAHGNRTYTNQNDVTNAESFTDSLDALDVAHGNRTYTEDNFVTDGESFTSSIDALDQQVKTNQTAISDDDLDPFWLKLTGTVTAGNPVTLPSAQTYTLDTNDRAKHMTVTIDGQTVAPDDNEGGVEDFDYEETSTTTITPHFTLAIDTVIGFFIRKS